MIGIAFKLTPAQVDFLIRLSVMDSWWTYSPDRPNSHSITTINCLVRKGLVVSDGGLRCTDEGRAIVRMVIRDCRKYVDLVDGAESKEEAS